MSSKKESLKKSLGITDYPWSSDDEDVVQENPEENPLHRPPSEPTPSVDESPGTSGEPQPQASPSSASTPPPTRNRTATQMQAKRDRDMFWALVNHRTPDRPQIVGLFNATRPIQHTPAPDLVERPRGTSPTMDIQRILALKRSLTRGYSSRPRMRPNTTFYAVPTNRSNAYGVRNPSYTPSSSGHSSSNMHSRSARMYPGYRRARSLMSYPYSGEIDVSRPSTSTADNNNDDNNEDQDNNGNGEDMSQNTVDGAISLEEEIVEIDATEVTIVDREAGMDEDLPNDDEVQEVLTIIQDMEEISTRNSDVIVAESVVDPHGVKRKREGTSDISTPYTVKDFNQCLLRLLECPVCLEWMEPPIAQCRRGHLVCARCRGRLASCPVCRTMFSSVRNRAMEGVAEMLRYPCRHGCGREVRLRRRGPHEASCPARKYYCPAPACHHRNPLPRDQLATHFQGKHLSMLKIGSLHKFTIKINAELSDDWLIMTLEELFHLRVDVDIRTWGVIVYVAYIGPKCNATNFMYEVTVDGHHHARRLNYTRATHSDLDIATLNLSRHDCFNLTLDQALNFLRFNNRSSESERFLDFSVEVKECVQPVDTNEDVDS